MMFWGILCGNRGLCFDVQCSPFTPVGVNCQEILSVPLIFSFLSFPVTHQGKTILNSWKQKIVLK